MTQDQLLLSIAEYFRGERTEAWVLAACALALTIAGIIFIWAVRDGFAVGLGFMLLIGALILGSTSATILVRDPGLQATLASGVARAPERAVTVAMEHARVTRAIGDFGLYTHVFMGLGAFGVGLLLFVEAPLARGFAVGLLIMLVAQVIIDHYGEARAEIYAGHLSAFAAMR